MWPLELKTWPLRTKNVGLETKKKMWPLRIKEVALESKMRPPAAHLSCMLSCPTGARQRDRPHAHMHAYLVKADEKLLPIVVWRHKRKKVEKKIKSVMLTKSRYSPNVIWYCTNVRSCVLQCQSYFTQLSLASFSTGDTYCICWFWLNKLAFYFQCILSIVYWYSITFNYFVFKWTE